MKRNRGVALLAVGVILMLGALAFSMPTVITSGSFSDWFRTVRIENQLLVHGNSQFDDAVMMRDTLQVKVLRDTTLAVTGNATVGGTLGVTGNASFGNVATITDSLRTATLVTTGNASVGGTMGVTGVSTLAATTVNGNLTVRDFLVNSPVDTAATGTTITPTSSLMVLTGTADVESLTVATVPNGTIITFLFNGTKGTTGMKDGKNLAMAGNLAYAPGTTIAFVKQGNTYYEIRRSIN